MREANASVHVREKGGPTVEADEPTEEDVGGVELRSSWKVAHPGEPGRGRDGLPEVGDLVERDSNRLEERLEDGVGLDVGDGPEETKQGVRRSRAGKVVRDRRQRVQIEHKRQPVRLDKLLAVPLGVEETLEELER